MRNQNINDILNNMVELTDENGITSVFELLDIVEHNEEEYVILIGEDFDGEVIILKIIYDHDDECYVSVEDEEVLTAVFEIFKNNNWDEYDFPD